MKNLMLGIVLGSLLTTGLGIAGGSLYSRDGSVRAPSGSQQQFDYFRGRQQQLDVSSMRRQLEQDRAAGRIPCGR